MTTALLGAGLAIHISAPFAAGLAARYSGSGQVAVGGIHARRALLVYDWVTIAAGCLVAPMVLSAMTWSVAHAWAIPAGLAIGAALPVTIWALNGARPARKRAPRFGLVLLPWVAAAEELLWRGGALMFFVGLGFDVLWAMICATAGFLAMHWYVARGVRGLPYLLVLTALLWGAFAVGGVVCAAAVHIGHNMTLALSQPKTGSRLTLSAPLPSSKVW